MRRDEIRQILAEILEDIAGVHPEAVTEDKVFAEDLDVDSLSMVEVMVALEDRFGVGVADEEAEGLQSVGDVVTYVEKRTTP